MIADRWQRMQEFFDGALARPPEERASFVAEACGEDAELRAEVESLLAQDDEASANFMRPPEPGPSWGEHLLQEGPDPLIGERIGPYRVESIIASGGMATVYKAEQDNPRRFVALKVMKGAIASPYALRHFEYESQILASLTHPNLAQVYQAGTHQHASFGTLAVPYFAMEYIQDAVTITGYARQRELVTRERLELFTQVCDGVQCGHQKGIIHRDLKPGNILVDPAGRVRIIDFGVARSTNSDVAATSVQSDVGQLIGTLQYMSPEQYEADPLRLDTRSDVYALGVVLYELLCGQLPYRVEQWTIPTAARTVCEEPPIKPSTIDRKLRGPIEAIVLKALEKDREKRYQSVTELAQDIRRYLNGAPIEAKPPTTWTRVGRWVCRHPVVTTTTGCLAIGLIIIAATFVSIWFLNLRPHKIWLSPDGLEARLLSAAGRNLHTWRAEVNHGITFAGLLERSPEHGGGLLALLGYSAAPSNRFPGALCAYDVARDLDDPVWRRRMEDDDVLPIILKASRFGNQFIVSACKITDVFPERPGDEIIAIHQHRPYSPCAVRIYDQGGEELSRIWHNGALRQVYWMSGARLLVFAGHNSGKRWDERGYPEVLDVDPRVVFAIQPVLGGFASDYLPSAPGPGPLDPAWYWCLGPPEALSDFTVWYRLGAPWSQYPADRFVTFQFGPEGGSGAVRWTLDAFGREVPGTRVADDHYKRNPALPDWTRFDLGPLPPIVSESDVVEGSPDDDAR